MVRIDSACFRVLAESPRRTGWQVFPCSCFAEGEGLLLPSSSLLTNWLHWISRLTSVGCAGASSGCWETARGVLTAPTAHSYPKPGKAVCGNGYEGHAAAAPFPSRPRFLLWTGRRHLEGERPTARDSGMDTSLVTYFYSQAICAHQYLFEQR